jgi:hypothetical protein
LFHGRSRRDGKTLHPNLQPETCIANSLPAKNPRNFIASSVAGNPFAHETDKAKPVLDKK